MMWNLYSWCIVEKLGGLRGIPNSLLSVHLEKNVPVLSTVQVLFRRSAVVQTLTFLETAIQNWPVWNNHCVWLMPKIDERQSRQGLGNSICFAHLCVQSGAVSIHLRSCPRLCEKRCHPCG